ncbi:MAG: bifunctional glutamate N-acetyltransferase/amino-acid acetyltransferase ArgJ [Planctomycetaceae bacterium]
MKTTSMNNSSSIPLPLGFRASGLHCGIKDDSEKNDLALFASDLPCAAAGVFTQNRVCGAPVKVSRERVPGDSVRALIINSGNANACTGEQGIADARQMTSEVANSMECDPLDVLVCSTGVIGHILPMEKISTGISNAVESLSGSGESFHAAARGMMTTDTYPKQAVRELSLAGKTVRVSGAAKGAAMIAPNMATMLAVVMTDAELSPKSADAMLREAVNRSFNCITVEGHTSTSDSVILLANGAAKTGSLSQDDEKRLQVAVNEVCEELAKHIIRDAEGASHFITIDVTGLKSRDDAHRIAKNIAEDPLVKTAITGADPNWGRIVSATGFAGVDVSEEEISLSINGTCIYSAGKPLSYDEAELSRQMREECDVHIEVNLDQGDASVRFWTCDLTQEYVRLNSEYTT